MAEPDFIGSLSGEGEGFWKEGDTVAKKGDRVTSKITGRDIGIKVVCSKKYGKDRCKVYKLEGKDSNRFNIGKGEVSEHYIGNLTKFSDEIKTSEERTEEMERKWRERKDESWEDYWSDIFSEEREEYEASDFEGPFWKYLRKKGHFVYPPPPKECPGTD